MHTRSTEQIKFDFEHIVTNLDSRLPHELFGIIIPYCWNGDDIPDVCLPQPNLLSLNGFPKMLLQKTDRHGKYRHGRHLLAVDIFNGGTS